MKRILVTGGSGFLGGNVVFELAGRYEVVYTYQRNPFFFKGASPMALDLLDGEQVEEAVARIGPSGVIHCAALTDVGYCQAHPDEARLVNVEGTRHVARGAAMCGAKVIYVSTESVYDGKRGDYAEDSPVGPVNRYAESKLEGEKAVSSETRDFFIARVGIEGWGAQADMRPLSFFERIVASFRRGEKMRIFNDWFYNPVTVNHLARVFDEVLAKDVTGIFNVGSPSKVSNEDFTRIIARAYGYDESLIETCSGREVEMSVPRPFNRSFITDKIRSVIRTPVPDAGSAVQFLKNFEDCGDLSRMRGGEIRKTDGAREGKTITIE